MQRLLYVISTIIKDNIFFIILIAWTKRSILDLNVSSVGVKKIPRNKHMHNSTTWIFALWI